MRFRTLPSPAPYLETVEAMECHVDFMITGCTSEEVWLLEHPPLYTLGTSAKESDLLPASTGIPTYPTGRGGQITYHGPGQRVAYVMLDLSQRKKDVRHYIWMLEEWLILTLKDLKITAERRQGRIGLWVFSQTGQEEKIAAIGVRLKKWITFHGISLNICPDLSYYEKIIPCGLAQYGVTSLAAQGLSVSLDQVDEALKRNFLSLFGAPSSRATLGLDLSGSPQKA